MTATFTGPRSTRKRPTVLFICHNHPKVRPGGAEAYALELHRHLQASGEADCVFLAKGGPPLSTAGRTHLGTYIAPVDSRPDEYFCFTEDWDYDWTFGTIPHDKRLYTKHLRAFIKAIDPDIVHFHHTMFFGFDILREVRNSTPDAAIVYTLHEFMPICHRQGQMVRTVDEQPCMEESPRRCHECFPEISPQTFFLRKKFAQSHFDIVDRFIAPSKFLSDRYIDWGIPTEKVLVEEYGRSMPPGQPAGSSRRFRDRFAFFGQLTPFKGLHVVLEAMAKLSNSGTAADDPLIAALERASAPEPSRGAQTGPRPQVRVYGANLDLQPGPFQNRVKELLEQTRDSVTFVGKYDHDALAAHMSDVDWVIVPSIWWENSPLVIQEAFHFSRPILCSDIGGMAEKVTNNVDGLHFRANNASSLAETIERAASDPDLWKRLRSNIQPVYRMEDHVQRLLALYDEVRDERAVVHA